MLERAFVLVPLAEIAPDRLIAGIKVKDALARLDISGIEEAATALGVPRIHQSCQRYWPSAPDMAFCDHE